MAHVIRSDFGETRLDALQRHSFGYFLNETNPANGLVADRTQPGAPASIAAVGFALAAYPVGVERGWMTRTDAIERTLALLRFFWTSPQGTAPDMSGYKGFYYHFLDMTTGGRVDLCELSTVDTSFLPAMKLAEAEKHIGCDSFRSVSAVRDHESLWEERRPARRSARPECR